MSYGFSALGKQIANVITDYLSRKYNLTPTDTYTNPKLLIEALEKSFGYGAVLIETRIIKSLRAQLSLPLEGQPMIRMGHPQDFEKYIQELQSSVENRDA